MFFVSNSQSTLGGANHAHVPCFHTTFDNMSSLNTYAPQCIFVLDYLDSQVHREIVAHTCIQARHILEGRGTFLRNNVRKSTLFWDLLNLAMLYVSN